MSEEIVTDYVLVSDSIEIIPDTIEIIPDTIVIPKNIDSDLVFRQINHFEKDYNSNSKAAVMGLQLIVRTSKI